MSNVKKCFEDGTICGSKACRNDCNFIPKIDSIDDDALNIGISITRRINYSNDPKDQYSMAHIGSFILDKKNANGF